MYYDSTIKIGDRKISISSSSYFIADIAANHDGELDRAKELIWLAKEAGADAVKFQHFKAGKIVSDYGFKQLGRQMSHQAGWSKSVYEVYEQYECNRNWSQELAETSAKAGIDFMTTPYDIEAIHMLDAYVPVYKIGSGDITWTDFIEIVAQRNKPVLLATGASTFDDVDRAVQTVLKVNRALVLLQCNTNYTGSADNFRFVNLRVLQSFALRYPHMLLGLSDHTPGHACVLGAISLGARVMEKHFTDDNGRVGPDHPFSMNPASWKEMMERSRELEAALGDSVKRIEDNEMDTVVVQRRCIRLARDREAGKILRREDLEILRPAPIGSIEPYKVNHVIGRKLIVAKVAGDALYPSDLEVRIND